MENFTKWSDIMNNTFSNLIDNIKYYRIKNNLTQEQLAELADLSVSYIKQLESKKVFKNISLITLTKLATALKVEPNELLRPHKNVKITL